MQFYYRSALIGLTASMLALSVCAQTVVLEDDLTGSTTGTRFGGTFLADGWKVTGHTDSILWHIPTMTKGAVEWDIRGLNPNENRPGMEDKAEIFHMYDYTFGNADVNYNGGYRDDPYKHFIRKIGTVGGTTNAMELVWQISPNYEEPDTSVLSWNPNTTYHFREEWGPDGAGNSVLKTYRDGSLLRTISVPGTWAPTGHSVRIAASPRAFGAPDAGAPVDAVYSNLKVWDLTLNTPPPPLPDTRTGDVALSGRALSDDGEEFLGLGASYFQALRHAKYDRERYREDLDFLARRGFNYIRTLTMVGGNSAWAGKEIAPITFTNDQGQSIQAWPDYWDQLGDMIDIAYDEYGLRTQLTLFADAQNGMPNEADRIAHMNGVLDAIEGREHKVMLLEVANEYWQNGFPGSVGIAKVREFGAHLAAGTDVLVALSSTNGTNEDLQGIYQGSAADVATDHFSRDRGTVEGGWLPVRDPYRINSAVGLPPVISNEPIGPGSSVNSENDPIKLVSAAAYAWMSGLPAYVFHSNAGVLGNTRFEDMAGVDNFQHLQTILPGDIANWQRTEGKDSFSPFITYANGQANKWWTEVGSPSSGAIRNLSNVKGNEFYTLPIGILAGGVELEPRQNMTIQVFNPLSGEVVYEMTPSAGARFTLGQGPQAYIIRGSYDDGGPARIDLDEVNKPFGLVHPNTGDGDTIPFTIGGRDARRNENTAEDFYMYFAAADWFTFQGEHPTLFIAIEYFDEGTGPISLHYDSNTGNTIPAFFKNGGSVQRGDTDTWKTHVFRVTDAYFGNRQNYGSDFRIAGGTGNPLYLDGVKVMTSILTGDADLDGDVDLSDLATLAGAYGATSGKNWVNGDFDFDGDVDLNDLSALAGNYGNGEAQAFADFQSLAVPEPAAGAAIACTSFAIFAASGRTHGGSRR